MSATGTTRRSGPIARGAGTAGSDPDLVARIRDEIEVAPGRRITFARFMDRALTEPGLGYYATSELRPTRSGDFLTAPELHPFFGRCLGRALAARWSALGAPRPFAVLESGAGRGTLGQSVRDGLDADGSELASAIEWRPADLPGRHPPPRSFVGAGAVVANEYLDALPVHRLVARGASIHELWVTWLVDRFEWLEAELSDPALVAPIEVAGVIPREGQVLEVRPGVAAWVADVARRLDRGLVIIVDYGHDAAELYGPRRMAGTLMTYRGHLAGDDPLVSIGRQDITAHVDMSDLKRAAAAHAFVPLADTRMARFLTEQGLGDMLSDLGRDPATDPQSYADARAAVLRLLDPRHLGGHRVLMFERG